MPRTSATWRSWVLAASVSVVAVGALFYWMLRKVPPVQIGGGGGGAGGDQRRPGGGGGGDGGAGGVGGVPRPVGAPPVGAAVLRQGLRDRRLRRRVALDPRQLHRRPRQHRHRRHRRAADARQER